MRVGSMTDASYGVMMLSMRGSVRSETSAA